MIRIHCLGSLNVSTWCYNFSVDQWTDMSISNAVHGLHLYFMKPKESRCRLRKASSCSVDIVGCGNSAVWGKSCVFLRSLPLQTFATHRGGWTETQLCHEPNGKQRNKTYFWNYVSNIDVLKVFHAGLSTIGLTRKHRARKVSVRFHVCEILILKPSLLIRVCDLANLSSAGIQWL